MLNIHISLLDTFVRIRFSSTVHLKQRLIYAKTKTREWEGRKIYHIIVEYGTTAPSCNFINTGLAILMILFIAKCERLHTNAII